VRAEVKFVATRKGYEMVLTHESGAGILRHGFFKEGFEEEFKEYKEAYEHLGVELVWNEENRLATQRLEG